MRLSLLQKLNKKIVRIAKKISQLPAVKKRKVSQFAIKKKITITIRPYFGNHFHEKLLESFSTSKIKKLQN